MPLARRNVLLVLAGFLVSALFASAPSAYAYKSSYRAQPGYPGSTLAMKVKGKPRVGAIVTLEVTGTNDLFPEPFDPDFPDRQPLNYTLDVYVQDRSVYSNCAPDLDAQNDRIITLPDKVSNIAGILDEGPAGPFKKTIKYRAGSSRKIMFCAYTRYSATDDIVMASLKHDLAKKKRARRGRR